ncbi:MAG: hypothetical protein RBS57_15190 [Desulforhabdus sp.]|jgi:hypothetical protein|nr:hypothetical protein [Desulforhabdus sp.]
MASESEPKLCSFQQIKSQLDPRCVYLIFEKAANPGSRTELFEVNELLEPCRAGIVREDLYYDEISGRLFMVIEVDPQQAHKLQRILLHPRLPRNAQVYLYGNLP